jgi:isochorismate pyruvate lyase
MEKSVPASQVCFMTDRLTDLRRDIDSLDQALVDLLSRREKLVGEVLIYKKANNLPGRIPARVNAVIDNAERRASDVGMNPDLARTVWTAMVEWFVRHEEKELGQR